jgi:hypothetical protein
MVLSTTALGNLPRLRDYRSKRASSWDRTGGNKDFFLIEAGERKTFAELSGPGCVKHIWTTLWLPKDDYLRRVVLRVYWDDQPEPSVECPLGDFFGLGHGKRKNFVTAMMQMSPQDGRGMNCWWPMPFKSAGKFEIENPGDESFPFYFYIDYEAYDVPQVLADMGYFHVQWRRENPTEGWGDEYADLRHSDIQKWAEKLHWGGDPRSLNLSNRDNYVILDTPGNGIFCGAHLDVDVFERQKNDWFGEGDDMIFIDGEPWPPSLHGTGTEDWYNCAYSPREEYTAPYHGVLLYNGTPDWFWKGKQSVYRYYIEDPIRFRKSIHVSIEHGHANKLANDYSSTAYYYLAEPRRGGEALLPVDARLPRPDEPPYAPEPQ